MFSLVLFSGLCTKLLFKWCRLHFCTSFHQGGPRNDGELWSMVSGHRFSPLMNGGTTRRDDCAPSFLFASPAKNPRMPPEEGLLHPLPSHLLLKGHKANPEGKSNFLLQSLHSFGGFLPLFAVYFHKAYNYLGESPSSESEWGLCTLLSSALSCFWEEGRY